MAADRRQALWLRGAGATRRGASAQRSVTDGELLRGLAAGDLEALAQTYDRYIDTAWRAAMVLAPDERSAAEAVRLTFLDVWRRPATSSPLSLGARLLAGIWRAARQTGPRPD